MSELIIKNIEVNINPEKYRTKTAFVFPESKRNSSGQEHECLFLTQHLKACN
ncbi:hypothetical protein XBKQ1_2000001 [Xenorhabdus bovienii str. kraussei Quebec]|uniref:Uncharacterized protein n=1 Tax=Xenorhabdus bovienii str. kraussei Quebec TaxID=1398203 RepID=A0A077P4A4_XENBV|nr:hypothetical protein [Xenorhabdus bovienii]CDH19295.1 hypothetical protein XBKQ1_2000001 [Xenorhabdus bovienii str. kraussei Quebec]